MGNDRRKNHIKFTGPHVYASAKLKFCWVRIPKCASSTVRAATIKHVSYHKYCAPHDRWEDYFKFAFARNPWSRLVSCYTNKVRHKSGKASKYLLGLPRDTSFKAFLKEVTKPDNILKDRHFSPVHTLLVNKSYENMDFIGRVENLQQDFNVVCDKVGISRRKLPHNNKSKHKHYTEYYDDETREIVAEKYAKDIEYLGYEFGA